jgi:NADH dehydrogenase/NADH:ubiquinone oxidoreductase subunit G
MGICFDCTVTVDGMPNVRACLTPVADGMVVETEQSMELSA